jgi:hypothetical protein
MGNERKSYSITSKGVLDAESVVNPTISLIMGLKKYIKKHKL